MVILATHPQLDRWQLSDVPSNFPLPLLLLLLLLYILVVMLLVILQDSFSAAVSSSHSKAKSCSSSNGSSGHQTIRGSGLLSALVPVLMSSRGSSHHTSGSYNIHMMWQRDRGSSSSSSRQIQPSRPVPPTVDEASSESAGFGMNNLSGMLVPDNCR